jgi:hypothetical protein
MAIPSRAPGKSLELVLGTRTQASVTNPLGHPVESINEAVGTPERAVIVESETNSLVTFSLDGKNESRTPNTGAGGAMLANPVQMALDDRGELLILDAQNPRIARFSMRGPSLVLVSVVKLQGVTGVTGICSLGGKTFVVGATLPLETSKLLHTVGPDGRPRVLVKDSVSRAKSAGYSMERAVYSACRKSGS